MPLLIFTTSKFIKKPSLLPVSLRWLSSCACHTGLTVSIAFSSQTTFSSTKTSKRRPSSKVILSYTMGISICLRYLNPLFSNSWQKQISYTLSKSPGPKFLCTICCVNNFFTNFIKFRVDWLILVNFCVLVIWWQVFHNDINLVFIPFNPRLCLSAA